LDKVVVITGSTRGIGFGLAQEFLKRGCKVVISGRTAQSVDKSIAELSAASGTDRLIGQSCDVSKADQVQALWYAAKTKFGKVDIWINNAGVGQEPTPLADLPADVLRQIVDTNFYGVVYGSQVALRGMIAQGFGQLYNMEGYGSDGRIRVNLSVYGSTKRAVRYLTHSLVKEMKDTPVLVGTLSPGMVVTDLLMEPYKDNAEGLARAKRIFNILADRVETVAPFLVEKVLANNKTGAKIAWLTNQKIFTRFLMARFNKRNVFDS
jgi:NAD(P)-dependent dehydrogenase (short-subunit alcohol dehydrogenase family)